MLPLLGSEHHGTVKFGGLPLPGASVTAKPMNAKEGDKSFSAITDLDGNYSFADLPDGVWTIQAEMPLFSPVEQEVTVGAGAAAADWDLKLLPADQIQALVTPAPARLQVAEARPNLKSSRRQNHVLLEPEGWWVERDSADRGVDSWSVGAVPEQDVLGLVVRRLWPLWRR